MSGLGEPANQGIRNSKEADSLIRSRHSRAAKGMALALLAVFAGTGASLRTQRHAPIPNVMGARAAAGNPSAELTSAPNTLSGLTLPQTLGRLGPASNTLGPAANTLATASKTLGPVPPPREAISQHVVVLSIDGLRPDAIREYDVETLQRLMREGSYSLEAQTIFPSKTLPSHSSMLTGVTPEVHGIVWNSRQSEHGVVQLPTVFELAKQAGYQTAAFFSKAKLRHLIRPGSLDYWRAPESNLGHWMATRTVPAAVDYLKHERPNLLFVHIGEPDYAGHSIGWMTFVYGWAVKRSDAAVARVLEAADEAYGRGNYTVLVTSDHGGHGRDHGSDDPRDMTIPWIAWGKGVEAGTQLRGSIRTMDTAATTLWLLGAAVPRAWAGAPILQAFTPVAAVGRRPAANIR